MPTERMEEVEVVCPNCDGAGYWEVLDGTQGCGMCGLGSPRRASAPDDPGPTLVKAVTRPGSLTAARLRLADAAEAAGLGVMCADGYEEARRRFISARLALAELRAALRTARGA